MSVGLGFAAALTTVEGLDDTFVDSRVGLAEGAAVVGAAVGSKLTDVPKEGFELGNEDPVKDGSPLAT